MFNVGRPVAGLALVSAAATDMAQRAMTGGRGGGGCKQHRAAGCVGGMVQLLHLCGPCTASSAALAASPPPPALADPLGQSNICFTASMCHLLGAQRLFDDVFLLTVHCSASGIQPL
jgi:hypothetical protein